MSGVYQAKQPVRRFQAGGTADRTTGTTTGTTMVLQQATQAMVAAGALTGRGVTKLVASSTASAAMRAAADYVCDGVADDVEINAALSSLAGRGTLLLSEGTFTLAAPIYLSTPNVTLRGMGMAATILVVVNSGGLPVNAGMVQLSGDYTEVADLTVDCNKANNATATGMSGIYVGATASPRLIRVRVTSSPNDGIVVWNVAQNAVIRDCVVDASADIGFYVYVATGQPLVLTGCSAGGNGGVGFYLDGGSIVASDCQALNNSLQGFGVYANAAAVLNGCTAISNGRQGFWVNAAVRTVLNACRSVTNGGAGFDTDGNQIQYNGCMSSGTTSVSSDGYGFRTVTGALDVLYNGCLAADNAHSGFLHNSAGRASYVGCRAINSGAYGWFALSGPVMIRGCSVVGAGASNSAYAFGMFNGSGHVVNGCWVTNIGGHGIFTDINTSDVQIVNNMVTNSGLNTPSLFGQIFSDGDRVFVNGNVCRDPASGNRPAYAIKVQSDSSDSFIGLNDTRGSGITKEIEDVGVRTRRTVKGSTTLLDFTLGTDFLAGAVSANVPANLCAAQTFTVDNNRDFIQINVRGSMLAGNSGTTVSASTFLLVDGVYYKFGAQLTQLAGTFCNPFTGGGPLVLTGLSVGSHTVQMQLIQTANGNAYIRAASNAGSEFLNIQVVGYQRA